MLRTGLLHVRRPPVQRVQRPREPLLPRHRLARDQVVDEELVDQLGLASFRTKPRLRIGEALDPCKPFVLAARHGEQEVEPRPQ